MSRFATHPAAALHIPPSHLSTVETTAVAMTWCRACGGGGDFFDGQDYFTCGQCGGLGEHLVDVTAYGVAGNGIEASYDPADEYPTVEIPAVVGPAPVTVERPILDGLPHVARARYGVHSTRWGRVRAAGVRLVHGGWTEQRMFVLLAVAAIGALVFGLVVLEHFHPTDALGPRR